MHVSYCVLHGTCCVINVDIVSLDERHICYVRCAWCVICCMLHVVVVCCLLFAVRCVWFNASYVMCVTCGILGVVCFASYVAYCMLCVA